jgi:hypothetical protein
VLFWASTGYFVMVLIFGIGSAGTVLSSAGYRREGKGALNLKL